VVLPQLVGCWDYAGFVSKVTELAARHPLARRRAGWVGGSPLEVLRLTCPAGPRLRVVVTAGVHGVEPSGPAAALMLVERWLQDPASYRGLELTVLPLVNPVGFRRQTRGNGGQIDLNRSFTDAPAVPLEVRLLRGILRKGGFHLGIDLHASRSVGERGVFALHRGSADLLLPAMRRFAEKHPILRESTDLYALEGDGVLRSDNVGTIKDYLHQHGARWATTIEVPAAWTYERQVQASVDVVETLVETARDSLAR
jgi:predicted deacylase